MTLHVIHSALATAAWGMFILVALAAAVAFREEALYAWRHRGWRNEREDSDYDALREPGMGEVHLRIVAEDNASPALRKVREDAERYAARGPERIDGDGA